ncbi:MAG: ABC transporter substrate-binding protein [Solidesulfovibrio sp. DCME]|uniref:ABC transporter substrate-binding protein n=1 Tax=Solidesulfovibrio sp. DCME TaxID=3447380 RepID=UPI003D0E646B
MPHHRRRRPAVLASLTLVAVAALWAATAQARSLTDADGQRLTLPDAPKRVYALSPPDSLLVYALDPCLLAGWNYAPLPPTLPFLPACAKDLPVLGGFFGKDETPDEKALAAAKPDLVVSGSMAKPQAAFEAFFAARGIPVVHVASQSPNDYPAAWRLLGEALDRRGRAAELAAAAEETLAAVRRGLAGIPQDKRLTVYYAEGGDGLYTDGGGSFHTVVLDLAGGINVHTQPPTDRKGMDRVPMEAVVASAPQVILAQDAACRDMILSSPAWGEIPAVKAGRVYLLPDAPFGWFDRPPSFMRLLCLKWLANILYPEAFPYDMAQETKAFFKLFLQVDLTDAQATALLQGKAPAVP